MQICAPDNSRPVVVVGGGPVGLTAANLLAARGVRTLLVERNPTTSDAPKAISIDDESLRMLQGVGLAEEVGKVIVPGTGTRYYGADGALLFLARGARPLRLGHPFKNPFAQPELEHTLRGALERQPLAEVRFDTELISLDQRDGGVEVEVRERTSGATERVRAAFVLGCDGGRSCVRELLGIGMSGRSHRDVWLVVDVIGDPHRERCAMHHGDPRRPHVVVPGLGGRCRYEFVLRQGEGDPGTPPPFPLIRELLAPYREIVPDEVQRAVAYRFHALIADRWRLGRVFLLGDAAHMMPPFAGQGLNSGMRDAGNLIWKLAEVLHGRLSPAVLDSYEVERRPHAEAIVRFSQRLGRVVMTTGRRRARARDRIVRTALATGPGRRYLETTQYRPDARLGAGLLLVDPTSPHVIGTAIDQPRVFDVGAHRTVMLDDVIGPGWGLLGIDLEPEAWRAVDWPAVGALSACCLDVGLEDHTPRLAGDRRAVIDIDGAVGLAFAEHRGGFLLVRPDRIVAARFTPDRAGAVAARIASWLTSDSRIQPRKDHDGITTDARHEGALASRPARR